MEESQPSGVTSQISLIDTSEKSICLYLINKKGVMEFFVFTVTNKDFKYHPQPRKTLKTTKSGTFSVHLSDRYHHHHHGDSGMGSLVPVSVARTKSVITNGCTVLGSTIFCLGNYVSSVPGVFNDQWGRVFDDFHDVYFFDTNCHDHGWNGWKRGVSMANSRHSPQTLVFDGKIYVVGGNCQPDKSGKCAKYKFEPGLWAEIFDPCLGKSEPLPPPPLPLTNLISTTRNDSLCLVALKDPKKILLLVLGSYSDTVYSYDVTQRSWEELEFPGIGCLSEQGRVVAVGQTLYWFKLIKNRYELLAYDLAQKKVLRGRVQGLRKVNDFGKDVDSKDLKPFLFHLHEDLFCLIWVHKEIAPDPDEHDTETDDSDSDHGIPNYFNGFPYHFLHTRIHCAKVRVSKEVKSNGKQSLSAFVESCQSYIVDHPLKFMNAWMF